MIAAGLTIVALAAPASVAGVQSLGDIARREAERRNGTPSGRVFTNDDLAHAGEPPPAVSSSTPVPASAPEAKSPEPSAKPAPDPGKEPILLEGREKRDEQYWRTQAQTVRARAAKAAAELASAESRLAALDAAPQTPAIERERAVAVALHARLQMQARSWRDEVARLEARARADKIPPEWIR